MRSGRVAFFFSIDTQGHALKQGLTVRQSLNVTTYSRQELDSPGGYVGLDFEHGESHGILRPQYSFLPSVYTTPSTLTVLGKRRQRT